MEFGLLSIRFPKEKSPSHFQLSELDHSQSKDKVVVCPFLGDEKVYSANQIDTPNYFSLLNIPPWLRNSITQKEHETNVETAISLLKKEGFKKLVVSRFEFFLKKVNPQVLFERFCEKYPTAYVYLLQTQKWGTWMGASPETLFSLSGNELQSMSLAGTRIAGNTEPWGQKEQEEQNWVTRYLVETFSQNGFKNIERLPVQTLKAGPVEHLLTTVKAQNSPGLSAREIAAILHPTPAVGGYPQKEAGAVIHKIENYDRSIYTGFIMLETKNQNRAFVNLRCMQVFEEGCVFYAGGGITLQSVAKDEWSETVNKINTLKKLIENMD